MFTEQVKYGAFGMTKEASIDGSFDDEARTQYNKYLFQDEECDQMTARMVRKLSSMTASIPRTQSAVRMYTFLNNLVYKASVSALFSNELADDEPVYSGFHKFDEKFALAVAGCPFSFFPSALSGRELVTSSIRRVMKAIPYGLILARMKMFERSPFSEDDVARLNLGMLWASVGNTMPGMLLVACKGETLE